MRCQLYAPGLDHSITFGEEKNYEAPHDAVFTILPQSHPSPVQIFSSVPCSQTIDFRHKGKKCKYLNIFCPKRRGFLLLRIPDDGRSPQIRDSECSNSIARYFNILFFCYYYQKPRDSLKGLLGKKNALFSFF
jgi:hypothetical protein